MENLNEKTKKFRFNAVDAIIILAIVAVVCAAVLIFGMLGEDGQDNTVKVEYVVQISQVRGEISDKIKVGDTLIDSASKYSLGTVKSVEKLPYTEAVFSESEGNEVMAEYPEHYFVRVTVTADAAYNGSYYSIGGFRIATGVKIYTRFPDFLGEGYCISLHEIEK